MLGYTDQGTGPAIVLLHGWSLDRTTWEPQIQYLSTRGFRVIAPDLPGHGESVAAVNPPTFTAMPAAVVDLMDRLGVHSAVVAGLSMGGAVAAEIAVQYPHRVRGLLIAGNAMADGAGRGAASAARLRSTGLDPLVELYEPLMFSERYRAGNPEGLLRWASQFRANDLEAIAAVIGDYHGRRRLDTEITAVHLPAVVVFGSDDATTPVDRRSDYLGIPGSIRDDIAGAGHLSNVEEPLEFSARLLRLAARSWPAAPAADLDHAGDSEPAAKVALALSYLYVPADSERKLTAAESSAAPALILDLEDGVAPSAKAVAVANAARFVAGSHDRQVWVRVDPADWAGPLAAVVGPGLTGIFLAKAESADQLRAVAALLDTLEDARGLPARSIRVIPIVESPAGLAALADIASAPRVLRLGMGEADLVAALGIRRSTGDPELLLVRSLVVLASAVAGLAAPVASTSTDFRDLAALAVGCRQLRSLGFAARTAIHPAQLPVIAAAFAPTETEVARAQAMVAAFDTAVDSGHGVVSADGALVDLAVVRSARTVLDTVADRSRTGGEEAGRG